jgi:hypothetical protein
MINQSLKNLVVFIILFLLNVGVLISHDSTDIQQLIEDDLSMVTSPQGIDKNYGYAIISFFVTFFTILLKGYFKPFIEVYLMYFQRVTFYFLISLIGLSSVYLIARVYGYSRLSLLIYLSATSLVLYFSDKEIG